MRKRYLFISNMAAPYQVKFCYTLNEYFDTEFWFYEYIDETRPDWWKIPLGDKCKIMKASGKLPKLGYFSIGLFIDMIRFKPDIVVLSGYMKWHVLVLNFAKLLGAKVAIMSEPLRYVINDDQGSTDLITRENSPRKINLLKRFFKRADLYIGMGEVAKKQLLEELELPAEKVTILPYPKDIEEYYKHPLREKKVGDPITLLFANRLIERYQPMVALEVFKELSIKYPYVKMLMNADGPQKEQCDIFIKNNKLRNVEFLDKIDSWNSMHHIYEKSDILILPAAYSNGNISITEARASGMGMVLSDRINSVEENNLRNKNCFISKPESEDFLNAICKYMEKPELLKEHGIIGRQLVEKSRNTYTSKLYFETFKKYGFVE